MAYRAAVCDDNPVDAGYVLGLLKSWAEERGVPLRTEQFPSAEAFLFRYGENPSFDLLLLDIEMGRMDGVALAKAIRRENEAVQIIFVTGYSDYIAEGYEVAALHYLIKPVKREKLFSVLDRSLEKLRQNERCLTLELSGETVRIPFYEIRFLEVQHNYVTVHGKADYQVKRPLGEFAKELDNRFFRVGRSYIVNLLSIRRVTKAEACLDDGTRLPLPRGVYEALNRAIIDFT